MYFRYECKSGSGQRHDAWDFRVKCVMFFRNSLSILKPISLTMCDIMIHVCQSEKKHAADTLLIDTLDTADKLFEPVTLCHVARVKLKSGCG